MRFFPVLLAAVVAVAGLAALPSVAAAQGAVVITTDNETYIDSYGVDPFVHITVSGLEVCAGETVEAGLYRSPETTPGAALEPFAGRTVSVDVPDSGSFTADVRILWEQAGTTAHAAVVAPCIPDGFAIGEPLTFLHGDPPFGPILPAAPLPDGVAIDVTRPDELTVAVNVSGFPACADRNLAIHLATETGGSIFPDPNIGVNAVATFDDAGSASAALKLDAVPAGRYIVWIRSVCSGTWVAPGLVEVAGPPVTPSPAPSPSPDAPGPPVVGTGTVGANTAGASWLFLAAIAVLGAGGSAAAAAVARRR